MYGGGGQYDGSGAGKYGGGGGGQYDGNGGAANANSMFGGGGFMPSQTINTPEGSGGITTVQYIVISRPLLIRPN